MNEGVLEVLLPGLSGDRRAQLLYVLALGVLVFGTFLCTVALRFPRLDVLGVALASAGAAAWLLSNTPGEGSTLLVLQPGNGLTAADLAVLPAAVLVLVLGVQRLRRS